MDGRLERRRRGAPPEGLQNREERRRVFASHAGGSRHSKKSPGLASIRKLAEAWDKTQTPERNRAKVVADFTQQAGHLTLNKLPPNIGTVLLSKWRADQYAESTVHLHRRYLRMLLSHLADCGANHAALRNLPKVRKPFPRTVIAEQADVDRLHEAVKAEELWLQCWLEIAAGHGLRFSEIERLSAADFDEAKGTIKYKTKGGDTNELPATPALKEFIKNAPATTDPHEPIIQRLAGRYLCEAVIRRRWERLKKTAGVNLDINPHDLRRTLAVRSMDATNDMRVAQHILGHRSLQTTAEYLAHRDPEKIRPLLEELTKWTPAAGEPKQ